MRTCRRQAHRADRLIGALSGHQTLRRSDQDRVSSAVCTPGKVNAATHRGLSSLPATRARHDRQLDQGSTASHRHETDQVRSIQAVAELVSFRLEAHALCNRRAHWRVVRRVST